MSAERLLKFPDRNFNKPTPYLDQVAKLHLVKPVFPDAKQKNISGGLEAHEYALYTDLVNLGRNKKPISNYMLDSLKMGLEAVKRKKSKHAELFEKAIDDLVQAYGLLK